MLFTKCLHFPSLEQNHLGTITPDFGPLIGDSSRASRQLIIGPQTGHDTWLPYISTTSTVTQHELFQKNSRKSTQKKQRLTPEIGNSWNFQETLFKVGNAMKVLVSSFS
jgi:hypothetical protein